MHNDLKGVVFLNNKTIVRIPTQLIGLHFNVFQTKLVNLNEMFSFKVNRPVELILPLTL